MPSEDSKEAGLGGEEDEGEEAVEQSAVATVSLDGLLRSPAASPVLLELLHVAQATMAAADGAVKAAALSALRPQLQPAIDAALDKLVDVAAQSTSPSSQQQPKQEEGEEDEEKESSEVMEGESKGGLPRVSASSPQSASSLFEDKTAHYFFKRLLAPNARPRAEHSPGAVKQQQQPQQQQGDESGSSSLPSAAALHHLGRQFAERLLSTFRTSPAVLLSAASSNRGCFVLLALVDALDAAQQTELAQLCRQHKLHAHIDAALSRPQQQQQQHQPGAEPNKKRKRAQRKAAAAAATNTADRSSVAVMTGCRLLQAWIAGKQALVAEQAAVNGHGKRSWL